MSDLISLDDATDSLYAMQRSCERFAAHLASILKGLEGKKEGVDLWMEHLLEESSRCRTFHEGQVGQATELESRMGRKLASVRAEADSMALSDLKGEEKEGPTIHPELQKFKLEKQAKIVGKYGGVASPLLMAGGAPKGAMLKATASAAAVEIHYSKIEDKDARQLAQVMQFRVDKGGTNGSESQSQWQEETVEKKGKSYFKDMQGPEPVSKGQVTQGSPYGNELMAKLRERQNLEQAAAVAVTPPPSSYRQQQEREGVGKSPFGGVALKPAASSGASASLNPMSAVGGELAEILKRRQERLVMPNDQQYILNRNNI